MLVFFHLSSCSLPVLPFCCFAAQMRCRLPVTAAPLDSRLLCLDSKRNRKTNPDPRSLPQITFAPVSPAPARTHAHTQAKRLSRKNCCPMHPPPPPHPLCPTCVSRPFFPAPLPFQCLRALLARAMSPRYTLVCLSLPASVHGSLTPHRTTPPTSPPSMIRGPLHPRAHHPTRLPGRRGTGPRRPLHPAQLSCTFDAHTPDPLPPHHPFAALPAVLQRTPAAHCALLDADSACPL